MKETAAKNIMYALKIIWVSTISVTAWKSNLVLFASNFLGKMYIIQLHIKLYEIFRYLGDNKITTIDGSSFNDLTNLRKL